MDRFDFDVFRELAERDPSAFFRARERAIENFIGAHPQSEPQLRALQTRIDMARALAGTPLAATRELGRMLSESLTALAAQLQALHNLSDYLPTSIRKD